MRWIALLLTLGCLTAACDPGDRSPRAESGEGGEAWVPPEAYSYEVDSSCGERNFIGRFRIHVRQGQVTSVTALDASARAAMDLTLGDGVPTLETLLNEAAQAKREGADRVAIRYLPGGPPAKITIDHDADAIDDEACYTIEGFDPHLPPSGTPSRDGAIYAEVIRELVIGNDDFGRGRSNFETVYVIDGALSAAGRPRGDLLARPSEPFDARIAHAIREGSDGEMPTVRFVDRAQVAVEDDANMSVVERGVLIALGRIEKRGETVRVPNTLWCGGKCSRWLTYVLRRGDGGWTVTGTSGPVALS